MTAQFSEYLQYKDETHMLCSEPLGLFLEFSASTLKFLSPHTALWRGYVGTWCIENDRLYLIKLEGWVFADNASREVGLDALFPDYPDGVFAHWFTGELRCPIGAMLRYVHQGYGRTYEQDLFIRVKQGVVLSERVVVNGKADPSQGPFPRGARKFDHQNKD